MINLIKQKNLLFTTALCLLITLSMTQAIANTNLSNKECYAIDLKSGVTGSTIPKFIELLSPPTDANSDGWLEALVKLTLGSPSLNQSFEAAKITIYYEDTPTGLTLNIGDSITNNGGGGDAGTQSNDAEIQIGGLEPNSEMFDDLLVFGRDGIDINRGTQKIAQIDNIVRSGESISFTISNERIQYENKYFPLEGDIVSPWLYALAGQPDSEGPTNFEIFASFNRVIAGGRWGTGVGKVEICPIVKLQNISNKKRN